MRLSSYVPVATYLAMTAVIGLLTGTGIAPDTLRAALPHWMVIVWTVCVALGGLACTAGAALRKPSLESAGLAVLAWGSFMYGSVVAVVGYPYSFAAAAIGVALIFMCAIRLRELHEIRCRDRSHSLAEKVQDDRGL